MHLAFLSSKGGVGKSTLVMAIAAHLAEDKKQVTILDLDEYPDIVNWKRRWLANANLPNSLENVHVHHVTNIEALRTSVAEAESSNHHILIDTSEMIDELAMEASQIADAVLVPTMADMHSVECAAKTTLKIMPEVWRRARREIPCFTIWNNEEFLVQKWAGTPRLHAHMKSIGVEVLQTKIKKRTIYRAINNFACDFQRIGGSSAIKGRQEIRELLDEITTRISMSGTPIPPKKRLRRVKAQHRPFLPASAEELRERISKNVKRLMQQRRLEYSDIEGVALSTLYRVRSNAVSTRFENLIDIANALEVDITELLAPSKSKAHDNAA